MPDEIENEPVEGSAKQEEAPAARYPIQTAPNVWATDNDTYLLGEPKGAWGLIKFQSGPEAAHGRNGISLEELHRGVIRHRQEAEEEAKESASPARTHRSPAMRKRGQ